jgi:flavin-dependent dehydrogenase
MALRRTYRRLELEMWAREQALAAGAVYLDGFIEGQVLPLSSGAVSLTDEANEASLTATRIALCEGSDPRIAMRFGLRPDYSPEEQVHFARTVIARPQGDAVYRSGRTRTSWGMPIGVTIVPLGATTMVAVDTRIENVMRAARSTQEALLDLLSSPLGNALGLSGERIHTGIELTALRIQPKGLRLSHDHLLVGIDASGLIDAREARRADATIRSGLHLAAYLDGSTDVTWESHAAPLLEQVRAVNPRWHNSLGTGFIEEAESSLGLINSISKMGRGALGRWRKRA